MFAVPIRYTIYGWTPPKLTPEQEVEIGRDIAIKGRDFYLQQAPYLSEDERRRTEEARNMAAGRRAWAIMFAIIFFSLVATEMVTHPPLLIAFLVAGIPATAITGGTMLSARGKYRTWVDEMLAKYAAHEASKAIPAEVKTGNDLKIATEFPPSLRPPANEGSHLKRTNRWSHGHVALALPPIPAGFIGGVGCSFHDAIFDSDIGFEMYLLVLDTPEQTQNYHKTRPFRLLATSGFVRTSYGVIAYIIWTIAAGSPFETVTEQFLHPNDLATPDLMEMLAAQSHLKVLIVDNIEGEVRDWFEFENSFHFDDFGPAIAKFAGTEPVSDFRAAMQEAMQNYSTEDLKGS